ncbi:MAG: NmrA family NAD(P)-binding protein [Microcoleaceae cyanobacterium]|jgi:uncharacterized protein YbjT (DUF2867 family)
MTLLIVGATGTLGRQIARRALDEGHQVRCLVRNYKKASFLKEWGAELVPGDLRQPESLTEALKGVTAVIDAATARATDSLKEVDWKGKVSLIQAAIASGIDRYIFISFLGAEKYPEVPLLDIKRCTELYLEQSGLNYTILKPCGFLQEIISLYAIPILDNHSIWIPSGNASPIAYMDTQDIAKFALRALSISETEKKSFPVVGNRPWSPEEIISLCERISDKEAKVVRTPTNLLRVSQKLARFFQWTWNVADRLAFAEVVSSGKPLTASMDEVYEVFGLDPKDTTTVESYLQEYFGLMLKKLKAIEYEQTKQSKGKKRPKGISFF